MSDFEASRENILHRIVNIPTESFFHTLNSELAHHVDFKSGLKRSNSPSSISRFFYKMHTMNGYISDSVTSSCLKRPEDRFQITIYTLANPVLWNLQTHLKNYLRAYNCVSIVQSPKSDQASAPHLSNGNKTPRISYTKLHYDFETKDLTAHNQIKIMPYIAALFLTNDFLTAAQFAITC